MKLTNLDLYAKVEHLLGIQDATYTLHQLYLGELEPYAPKRVLDVGCGRGGFMKLLGEEGIACSGVDPSAIMVQACRSDGLDVVHGDIFVTEGEFDAIVCIFDVLNFLHPAELDLFFEAVSKRLTSEGLFLADVNTRYGFSDVADGSMIVQNELEFLSVDAIFENDELLTTLTLFEKESDGKYTMFQESIRQYFYPLKRFQKLSSLKLVDKQTFSLYDTEDKTLLIFKKK